MKKVTIDATNQSLGRLASRIAVFLRGKHLAEYQPNILPEVEVSVENLNKVKFTGNKLKGNIYHKYSGYHGGIKSKTLGERWKNDPKDVLRHSVYRMLPKNKTRSKIIKNLKFSK